MMVVLVGVERDTEIDMLATGLRSVQDHAHLLFELIWVAFDRASWYKNQEQGEDVDQGEGEGSLMASSQHLLRDFPQCSSILVVKYSRVSW